MKQVHLRLSHRVIFHDFPLCHLNDLNFILIEAIKDESFSLALELLHRPTNETRYTVPEVKV